MKQSRNTRQNILEASLELFNNQGERQVTTNHIAAHLKISTGNLYYHFSNKREIVAALFAQSQQAIEAALSLPDGREVVFDDKALYLEALLTLMWQYRFLHRDIEPLLATDAQLNQAYARFATQSLASAATLYNAFTQAGLLTLDAEQIEALSLNSWIVLSSWLRFILTVNPSSELDKAQLCRGIYQVLALEEGFVSDEALPAFKALKARLYVPLTGLF